MRYQSHRAEMAPAADLTGWSLQAEPEGSLRLRLDFEDAGKRAGRLTLSLPEAAAEGLAEALRRIAQAASP